MDLSLSLDEKKFLIETSKKAILFYFKNNDYPNYDQIAPKNLTKKGNCFVELFLNGTLRGSMGNFNGDLSLIGSVVQNAIGAAFNDPRFPQLSLMEFYKIKTSISLLSELTEISASDSNDLIKKFPKGYGISMVSDKGRSLMLPHMWEKFPTHEKFLSELSSKAGLPTDSWMDVKNKKFMIFESVFVKE